MDEKRDETTLDQQEQLAELCNEQDLLDDTDCIQDADCAQNAACDKDAACEQSEQSDKGILADMGKKQKPSAKEVVKKYCKRYFIDAFSGMAQGLFCTLIAGTILDQIARLCGDNGFAIMLKTVATIAKVLMGAGIGIGIAHKLGAKPLVIFTAAVAGFVGAWSLSIINGSFAQDWVTIFSVGKPGNPIGAYVVSLFTIEIAGLYAGKTKLDIVLVPLGMMILCMAGVYIAWPFVKLIDLLAKLLVIAIEAGAAVKIIVGIFVAVIMGILLTMPTSSAAIWMAIAMSATGLENPDVFAIAGGAAVAGCAAHMVGFAVASFRENGFGGLIAQGIGTSMLQIPNIMRRPVIMVPEIVASAISGLVAVLLDMRCNAAGGGMGTSGLVGIFGVIDASKGVVDTWKYVLGIILCMFVIPAVVSFALSEIMRKTGVIRFGDQQLD